MRKPADPCLAPIPPLDKILLDFLDKRYPERCPDLHETVDAIRYKAGQRDVVRFLLDQYRRQQESGGPTPVIPPSFSIPLMESCEVCP